MTTAKKHNVFKNIVQYLFLLLYIVCAVLIFVESAMPGSKVLNKVMISPDCLRMKSMIIMIVKE